jgi:hypothetical protein
MPMALELTCHRCRAVKRLVHERNSLLHRRARLLAEVELVERRLVDVEMDLPETERQTVPAPLARHTPAGEKPGVHS